MRPAALQAVRREAGRALRDAEARCAQLETQLEAVVAAAASEGGDKAAVVKAHARIAALEAQARSAARRQAEAVAETQVLSGAARCTKRRRRAGCFLLSRNSCFCVRHGHVCGALASPIGALLTPHQVLH